MGLKICLLLTFVFAGCMRSGDIKCLDHTGAIIFQGTGRYVQGDNYIRVIKEDGTRSMVQNGTCVVNNDLN